MPRHLAQPRAQEVPFELLENRRLLAAHVAGVVDNDAPRVEAVYLNSTSWTAAFRQEIQDSNQGSAEFGIETPMLEDLQPGDNVRNRTLPWINANQISIRFDEDVVVDQDDLIIEGVANDYEVVAFSYDEEDFVATWTLDGPITADIISLRLDGTPGTGVTDLAGNTLLGNCEDDAGEEDGEAGRPPRDFCQGLAVLPGDATRDGRVNALDLAGVFARRNTTPTNRGETGGARYSVFYDVTGDGRINALDLAAVRARANTTLPDSDNDDGGD